MNTPDVTPVQIGAASGFVAALGTAITTLVKAGVSDLVIVTAIVCATIVVSVLIASDALIRRGRAARTKS